MLPWEWSKGSSLEWLRRLFEGGWFGVWSLVSLVLLSSLIGVLVLAWRLRRARDREVDSLASTCQTSAVPTAAHVYPSPLVVAHRRIEALESERCQLLHDLTKTRLAGEALQEIVASRGAKIRRLERRCEMLSGRIKARVSGYV